jgi:hypothetical protein
LRHSLGSAAASAGEALGLIGALLGHVNARSTQLYAHISHDPARMAADRATGPIAEALGLGRTAGPEKNPKPAKRTRGRAANPLQTSMLEA